MIRIKADRCGYDKYKCVGIPQISEDSNGMFDENVAIVASMKAEFNKLPMRIKGMVFSEDTTNMSWPDGGPHPEVPELTCRTNTDPLSDDTDVSVHPVCLDVVISGHTYQYPVYGGTSGWADLFNAEYQHGGDPQYFYRNTVVGSTNAVASDVFIITGDTHWHNIYSLGGFSSGHNGVPNFTVDITDTMENSIEMGPGLLEPMLDTDFDPVDISTIPAWEAGDDAFTLNNILINGWKGVVDDRFRNIYARLNSIPISDADRKLRDLTDAQNNESECKNFQITLDSGSALRDPDDVDQREYHADTLPNADNTHTPITVGSRWHGKTVTSLWQAFNGVWWWTVEDAPNLYSVSGGIITYDSYTISVTAKSNIYAPFYAYLMPALDVNTTHEDVAAADVPTVVDGGTTRMIQDGDPNPEPSGGTVTGFTGTVDSITGATIYSWTITGDNTAQIVIKSGNQLTPDDGTADPEPGGIGIGGVRIIQGSDSPDPLVLYKIYHEDCISEIEKPEADAEAATAGWIRLSPVFPYGEELMDVEIPSGTEGVDPTVIGATAGIVQPVHNIQIHGSTDYRTQSPVDVPTVEAVYNFIHSYDDFADGEFEQASALATGSTMYVNGSAVNIYTKEVSGYTGSLAVPGTVIVATDIKTVLVVGKTITASGCVPTAQAVVDYIAGLDLNGSTSSISGTLTVVAGTTTTEIEGETVTGSTYTEGWVTTDPATPVRGTVEVSKKIVVAADPDDRALSNQAVPSVNAIYEFMHSTELNVTDSGSTNYSGEYVQALVTAGTISDAGNNSGRETWNGIPGTVMVVKNVWMNTYHNLSASAVPSVEAVYKFIHGMTVSAEPMLSALATPGAITPVTGAGGTVSGYTAGTMGVFFVATAISYPASVYTVSVDGCVPSVQAVIDYVTSYVSGRTASLGYIQVISDSPYERVENASYGLVRLVKNIDYSISQHTDASATETAVPSAAAVYEFIHARYNATSQKATALATAGTISTTATGTTITGTTFTGGEPGTIEVSCNIEEYNGGSETGCVPTADAVVKYVHGLGITGATPGTIVDDVDPEDSEATVEGWNPQAIQGTVKLSTNIKVNPDSHTISSKAAPTVKAVYDFIHSTHRGSADEQALSTEGTIAVDSGGTESLSGGTPGTAQVVSRIKVGTQTSNKISPHVVPTVKAIYEFIHWGTETASVSSPLASATAMTASTTAPTLTGATPGTMYVADTIEVDSTGNTTAQNCVPTAQAVVTYVATHGGGGTAPAAVHGVLTIGGTDNTEYVVNDGTITHVQGIVNVLKSVKYAKTVSKRAVSPDAVPSVMAVYSFIHNTDLDANDNNFYVQALATGATISTTGVNATCSSTPGTVRVANDIKVKSGTTTVLNADVVVPTVQAVVTWVAEHGGSSPVASVNNFSTAGLVYVADYLPVTGSHPSVTVPTVDAVWSAIQGATAGSGLRYPDYSVLTNDTTSGGTNLSPNTTYYVSGGGWLRVTLLSSAGCSCVTIDGSYNFGVGTPGGSGPMTWLIPVGAGHAFYVGTSTSTTGYIIKFDGICSQSSSSKSAGTTRALMKLNGISKYDPEFTEDAEEEDLMRKYGTTDTTGSAEDLEQISLMSQEAEANKNHVITQYETVVDHTKMFVTNSSRSTLCAEHVEELCEEAAEYYDAAMVAKTLSEAQAWLAQGDAVKAAACEWVGKTQAYGAAMTVLHNVDERTDYIELADGFIATAEERYDSTIAENENLLVIGVTGGAQFVDIAHRASQEAVEWKTKLEEEIENNAIVYARASSIASEAYDTAVGAYSKLEDEAQEASKYVNSLEKPQQR